MDLAGRFSSPLAAAAAAAAAGHNVASASTASTLFPYLFSNRNLHNYWLSTMKGRMIHSKLFLLLKTNTCNLTFVTRIYWV